MKLFLTLLLLIPSLSWGIEKEELREELKYWKSLYDDGLITQEDYDSKKNKLLESFNEKNAITEKVNIEKEDISENDLEIKNTSFFEGFELNTRRVELIQVFLNLQCYNLTKDGIFGAATKEALTDYYKKNGVTKYDYDAYRKLVTADPLSCDNNSEITSKEIVNEKSYSEFTPTHKINKVTSYLFEKPAYTGIIYNFSKNEKVMSIDKTDSAFHKVKTKNGEIGFVIYNDLTKLDDTKSYSNFKPTHTISFGNLFPKPKITSYTEAIYEFSNSEEVMSLNEIDSGFHKVKTKYGKIGYVLSDSLTELDNSSVKLSNYSTNDNKNYSNENDSKKESSSNNDSVANALRQQNEILEQQLEYQKKKDADEKFNKRMGNLFKFLLTPYPSYNNNKSMYCYNYGTASHPNVQCN